MKRIFNLKALLLVLLTAMAWSANAQVKINDTNFPDANFRSWLLAQDYGKDGVLTESEINSVTKIYIEEKNISTLTGIEVFKALKRLVCYNNQLTRLNVSENKALEYLSCEDNQLTYLNVSGNTALKWLWCQNNQLTTLDVSKNTALTSLECYLNQLTALDVSKNTALKDLWCDNNQLTALDVSNNTALTLLECYNNSIKGADMDALVGNLPQNTTSSSQLFIIVDISKDATEGNVCTKAQVDAAKAKGWSVQALVGNIYVDYEGSDDLSGITDAIFNSAEAAPVFTLSGQRLAAPRKGINIVGGKKIMVK